MYISSVAVSGAVTIDPVEPYIRADICIASFAVSGTATIDPAELSSGCAMSMMRFARNKAHVQRETSISRAADVKIIIEL